MQVKEEPPWELSEEQALWEAVGTPGHNYSTQTQSQHACLIDSANS